MESGTGGGIDRHLERTKAAATAWLKHEDAKNNEGASDALLLHLALELPEEPVIPQILGIIRQTRVHQTPYFNGALIDWPCIFRWEWDAALEAESEYERFKLKFLEMKAAHNANTSP